MPNNTDQKHRTNRVFKSMHKPLTYLGVERTLFYFVCVGAVGRPLGCLGHLSGGRTGAAGRGRGAGAGSLAEPVRSLGR